MSDVSITDLIARIRETPTYGEESRADLIGLALEAADALESVTAPTAPDNEALWDFAGDLLQAWNIEDTNEPSLTEQFRDMFVARFGVTAPTDELGEARNRITAVEEELAEMAALAQVNAMNVSDYLDAIEDAKQARAALAAVQQPNPDAAEALDRLTQIALDNTSEDVHEAVYEDAKRVRAEWQASCTVEAAPTDADREALIAAIRHWANKKVAFELDEDGDPLLDPEYVDGLMGAKSDVLRMLDSAPVRPVQVEVTDEKAMKIALLIRNEFYLPLARVEVLDEDEREVLLPIARAALEAALGGGE